MLFSMHIIFLIKLLFGMVFAGSFELAVLRMSRYFDLSQNCVLYADTMLPQDAFFTTETAEMKLVTCVFEFAKGVSELKLTETELALYSACVLLSAGLHGNSFINCNK
jgi:nuclear receptor subfamily 1 group F protein 4